MTVITFAYLIVPTGRFSEIPRSIASGTITISNELLVDNLRAQIQQLLPHPFSNVPFYLRAFHPTAVGYRVMREGNLISQYFSDSPTVEAYHVLIEEDVYQIYTL
ncbi:unnamed protein product [Rhizophagus irregularis]|nr:unnamed protein product [Rhizophagus irregularis]CAB5388529.1 unnamed protein product [Rhizophagus irregularis]